MDLWPDEARKGHRQWTPVRQGAAWHVEVHTEAGRLEMSETKYAVLFEKSATGFGAYVPDPPGCIATGRTLAITRRRMAEALAIHLRAMREDGDPIPEPSHVETLDIA